MDPRLLSDRRATNYWDPNRRVSGWISAHVTNEPGITWDAYFLYGPDADWESIPAPLARSGRPLMGGRDTLAAELRRLEET